MANDAFVDVFVMELDTAATAIVEIQLHPVGDMEDQWANRLRSVRCSCELFAIWTDRHGSMRKGINRRRSWKSVRD